MVLITVAEFLVIVLALFLLPGLLLVRLLARDKFEDAPVAVAFAVGTCWTCFWGLLLTGLVGLLAEAHVSAGLLAGVAAVTVAACILALRRLEGSFAFLPEVLGTRVRKAFSPGLVLFLIFVSVVWLLSYDSVLFDQERCVSRAGVLPYFDYLTADPPVGFNGCLSCFEGRNAFLVWNGGQRLGPTVFVAPFMALFGFAGFHLVHLFFGLLTAWFGFHLGRSLLGRTAPGYLLAAVLSLNPAVLSIPLEDENTMSLGLGTVLAYFLFQRRTQWLFCGMFFGLLLGIRHVGLLSLPALLWVVWRESDRPHYSASWVTALLGSGRWANLALSALGTVLFAAPCGIAHAIRFANGGPLYESFISMPPTQHSLFGLEVTVRGLLSWPFVPEPLRSPYNGFPTLLEFPLTILQAFGILGIALIPVGVWWGMRRHRTATVAGLLWFLPQLALLCTMANWVEPNKMGVYLSFAQPVGAAIVFGLAALVETYAPLIQGRLAGPIRALVPANPDGIPRVCRVSATGIFVGTTVLLAVLQPLASRWEAPLDRRNFDARVNYIFQDYPVVPPMLLSVEGEYARQDRERLAQRSLLPDFGRCRDLWTPSLLAERWKSLLSDLAAPGFDRFVEHPKDILHTLSGTPAPPEHTIDGLGGPDLRRGPVVLLADLMHHPISSIRDALGGTPAEPDLRWEGDGQVISIDLASAPAGNHALLTPASRDARTRRIEERILVATNMAVSWADGLPCHLAVIPVRTGWYWVVTWYGRYVFDHLADRTDVEWLDRPAPTDLRFEVPTGSVVRLNDMTSVEPSRLHVWTALATPELPLWGPIPSSY